MLRTLALLPLLFSPSAPDGSVDGLDRALDAVRPTAVRADVDFLAAPVLGGRETPSAGLEFAAEYLRVRVARLGLQPGARGAWFHEYALRRRGATQEDCRLLLAVDGEERELRPIRDYLWTSARAADSFRTGGVVLVGDAGRAALASVPQGALQDRWALATARPERLQSTRRRLRAAGALGVLIVDAQDPRDEDERDARAGALRRTERSMEGRLSLARTGETEDAEDAAAESGEDDSGDGGERSTRGRVAPPELPFFELVPERAREWSSRLDLRGEVGTVLPALVTDERVARDRRVPVRNLCALLPGDDPALADEWIVCTAHYDHVGVRQGELHPGADDNASGTAGLLAVAEALAAAGPRPRSVLFVWFSGEENGLWGSEAFCRDLPLPEGARVVANLNLDMIGRTEADELYLTPTREHAAYTPFAGLAEELCVQEGFPALRSQDEYFDASDHASFAQQLGVPVAFLSTGDHPDYHQPTDTPDKLDEAKVARVARLAVRVLFAASAADFRFDEGDSE